MHVKFVIVHITVSAAYAHLLHLRREKRIIFQYLLLLICPLAAMSIIVWPLIILAFLSPLLWGHKAYFMRCVGILIGYLPKENDSNEDQDIVTWPLRWSWKLLRQITVQGLLLWQCGTSVWLLTRRPNCGSAALYDYRILQLAVWGNRCIQTVLHVVLRPRCAKGVVERDWPVEL